MDRMKIGEVARRTGMTERTLRYYEELELLEPSRESGGHRVYDGAALARLYRIRLLRELGTPLTEVADGVGDLLSTVQRHLADVDERMAALARTREHARAVEATLLRRSDPTDEELLTLLSGVGGEEPSLTRRLTLLVYRDLEAVAEHLVSVFGLGAGRLDRDDEGTVVHAELHAGDGLLWLHQESSDFGLVSPATGSTTVCMAVNVDDVDQHHERVAATGADIVYPPTRMPYGVREYGVRDIEGGLWSFMQDLEGDSDE